MSGYFWSLTRILIESDIYYALHTLSNLLELQLHYFFPEESFGEAERVRKIILLLEYSAELC